MAMTRFDTPGYHEFKAIRVPDRTPIRVETTPISRGTRTKIQRTKTQEILATHERETEKADVGGAILESVKNSAAGLVFPPSLLVTYPETIKKTVTEAEKEDPVLALRLKELGEGAYAGGMGALGLPGLVYQTTEGWKATEDYRTDLVEKYPDIPVLQDVSYDLPGKVGEIVKIPELKLPDFGKLLLIGGLILGAILIIPALLSRRK